MKALGLILVGLLLGVIMSWAVLIGVKAAVGQPSEGITGELNISGGSTTLPNGRVFDCVLATHKVKKAIAVGVWCDGQQP